MLTKTATAFREAFVEILAEKLASPASNDAQKAWEFEKEDAQKIMVKLAVGLRKLRDRIDDLDNEFYEEGCTIWARVMRKFPLLNDVIERILGDLNSNIPQLLATQLEALRGLRD
ncbi:uncharacterized protein DFL_005313 [Arthrobotrys flagrans]|uniref:Uncharacterized protein n=1 Tax=Arthrobotrys flagrans TaxID=97331 RepID=A0A437A7H0_ARTFL|nr:hypothetical protein DFL_005313 [Arthrobotrys flagrans]